MERDLYKQTKLAKNKEKIFQKEKKNKDKKSLNKSVKLYFYYSTQKYDDSIIT